MIYKQCIIVRKDLGMSPGKMAVQVAHASIGCIVTMNSLGQDEIYRNWFIEGQRKIVLQTDSEETLHKIESKANLAGMVSYLVIDFGLTELDEGTETCLGIGPATNEQLKPVTGRLKLWQ